jgi:hypothetical protein
MVRRREPEKTEIDPRLVNLEPGPESPNGAGPGKVGPDPLNPEDFRISQDFADGLGVEQVILRVPVRKPRKQDFIRIHPEAGLSSTALLEVEEDNEFYLLAPTLFNALPEEAHLYRLALAITRQQAVFIWPLKLPGPDGRGNSWHESALEIAELAKTRWVRVRGNRSLGSYVAHVATGELDEPRWPTKSFSELFGLAFGSGRLISDPDHPVVQRLLGRL